MKYLTIVAALVSSTVSPHPVFDSNINKDNYYNILSMDGGGIRGLIPAMVIKHMEEYAYTYAKSKNYVVPQYPGHPNVIAMKDLFNMTAGTSTGSILAAGLAYPNATYYNLTAEEQAANKVEVNGQVYTHPGFFADELIDIYAVKGGEIFVSNSLSAFWVFLWFTLFVGVNGLVGFGIGCYLYDNESVADSFRSLRKAVSNAKRENKKQEPKYKAESKGDKMQNQINEALLQSFNSHKDIINENQQKILQKRIKNLNFDEIISNGIKDHVAETTASLTDAEKRYQEKKPLKWAVFGIGIVLGIFFGIEIPKVTNMLGASKYSRKSLDNVMKTLLGEYKFSDALTQELLVVAYEYNSQEPRFYSKYFQHQDQSIYDVPIGNATGSSSAAPTFFDPHEVINGYGYTELQIDGGVICNNPALYAYEMAHDLYGYKKLRVLSLGTGQMTFHKVDPETFNIAKAISMKSEFMMNMDAFSADFWLNTTIPESNVNYIRAQMVSNLSMDDISPQAILNLKSAGEDLWTANATKIKAMISLIIDERFHTVATVQS